MAEVAAAYPALALIAGTSREQFSSGAAGVWYDGPKLAAWMRARRIGQGDDNAGRRLRRWARPDAVAALEAVERALIDSSYGIHDVPDEFRVGPPGNYQSHWRYPAELRIRVADEYLDADPKPTVQSIAERYGIPIGTVRNWIDYRRAGRI